MVAASTTYDADRGGDGGAVERGAAAVDQRLDRLDRLQGTDERGPTSSISTAARRRRASGLAEPGRALAER